MTNSDDECRAFIDKVRSAWPRGWRPVPTPGFVFRSPSGSLHDLSAADMEQPPRIEREGMFLVDKEPQDGPARTAEEILRQEVVEFREKNAALTKEVAELHMKVKELCDQVAVPPYARALKEIFGPHGEQGRQPGGNT